MQTKSVRKRLALAAGMLLTASACGEPTPIVLYPPAIDVEAATEPKPVPPMEIATSEEAALAYDLELEAWGERVQSAGVRLCKWFNEQGGKFDCD